MRHVIFDTLPVRLPRLKNAILSFKRSPSRSKHCPPVAQSLRLVDDLSSRKQDKSQINLAVVIASRYFSTQFFASLEKWVGARNPVRIGSSCAAVTGYDFPLGQSSRIRG